MIEIGQPLQVTYFNFSKFGQHIDIESLDEKAWHNFCVRVGQEQYYVFWLFENKTEFQWIVDYLKTFHEEYHADVYATLAMHGEKCLPVSKTGLHIPLQQTVAHFQKTRKKANKENWNDALCAGELLMYFSS